jgi:NAD(P)-dependent dehydrogenase (short-subunit alcohol dehydrogenase family)
MERLKDRVAIVTGAAQGIGKALALGLSREAQSLSSLIFIRTTP